MEKAKKKDKIQDEIISRIGIHKVGLAFLQEFNWIEREQTVSDYGIDMHVEIVDKSQPTGQLIALQIKSGVSFFSDKKVTDEGIKYSGSKRHLDYWEFHSIPVLIILYHPLEDKIYWQKINGRNIIRTGKGWKTIIPKTNTLTSSSKDEIEKYYFNRNHFITIETSDFSHPTARRISAKILVNEKASSKVSMEKMIPFLIEEFRNSDYHRNKVFKKGLISAEADIVLLFFYTNIQQVKRGFPFCRVAWNSDECQSKMNIDNADTIINGSQIKWENLYQQFESFDKDQMSKGNFMTLAKESYQKISKIWTDIKYKFEKYSSDKIFSTLKTEILIHEVEIDKIDEKLNFKGKHAPFECIEIDKILATAIIQLSNIILVFNDEKRKELNLISMLKSSLNNCEESLKYFDYELKKIK